MSVKTKTIKLSEPVQWGTETITEVVVVKPKGKHLKKMPLEPKTLGETFPFLAAIIDQPISFLDELDQADIQEISNAAEAFTQGSPQTGGNA